MKCPECGKQTEGRDHNKRGLRCTFCWALLPESKMYEPTEAEFNAALKEAHDDRDSRPKPKPRRKRKPAPKKVTTINRSQTG